ncbi:MAG TPA: methyltransferase [Acidimicrobiaceae bacterium]|nr:methyltransferase [Acidimicrobiaceae bacterium]HCB37349.1 methyltransferase [Acidimicrobiaceae bacterium]
MTADPDETAAAETAPPAAAEPRRKRGGGRAGRIAEREAPLPVADRPIRPGMPAGRYRPLTDSDLQQTFDAALALLADIGMADPIPEFSEAVTTAGGSIDDDGRLRFPPDLIQRTIETAAKEWIWHGFDDDRSIEIGGDRVHFGTAGAAVLMYDHAGAGFRETTLSDVYDCARLVDTLDNIHCHIRTVVARDMVEARDLDVNTAYALTVATSKPVGSSWFEPEWVRESVELFDMALGGPGEFAKRPFMVANNTFVVPPLRFAYDSTRCLVEQLRAGMPVNVLSAGQAGATSPAALAGSLAQALAECLAGLTCVNLIKPGHPAMVGMWPFVSDLRTGAMSGGSGEEGVLNAAGAQVVRWLGLPVSVAAGMADSKIPDNQAGYEKGLNVALAGHAGANVVFESAGMLASLLACSMEALVIDNDMLGSINRTIRGIEVDADTLSTGLVAEVVHGAGHFLGAAQTLELMQREYVYPAIGNRDSPDDWADAGALSATEAAHKVVERTLAEHRPSHVDAETDARIRAAFPIKLPPL